MATVTLNKHLVFESVTGLTNTTFDPDNYKEDRMATEAQIQQIEQAISDLQAMKEHCCREIVVWRSYVRVIAEDTGIVLSDWTDNAQVGRARRGEPFTVEFSLPHDSARFFDDRSGNSYCKTSFNISVSCVGRGAIALAALNNSLGCSADGNNAACGFGDTDSRITVSGEFYDLLPKTPVYGELFPLPQLNGEAYGGNFSIPAGLYYMYKDATDNKIKIDVKRRDQYAANEYMAVFLTQFVQRKEYV